MGFSVFCGLSCDLVLQRQLWLVSFTVGQVLYVGGYLSVQGKSSRWSMEPAIQCYSYCSVLFIVTRMCLKLNVACQRCMCNVLSQKTSHVSDYVAREELHSIIHCMHVCMYVCIILMYVRMYLCFFSFSLSLFLPAFFPSV